jgi:hypothetical protein
VLVTLVTADGDAAIHSLVLTIFGRNVLCHHDPNHYAKGLEKSFKALTLQHPSLALAEKKLKAHFLIGTLTCSNHNRILPQILFVFPCPAGVKMFVGNTTGFQGHMCNFIPHITNQDHHLCLHPSQPHKPVPLLDEQEHPEAVSTLKAFIEGYLEDCEQYLHSFSTIQNKSINSSFQKCNNKECNWTTMYGPLTDAGVLE